MTARQAVIDAAVERYVRLESLAVMETVLTACGATIDRRARPFLTRRLAEEVMQNRALTAHGYTRMAEKSAQLLASLRALIAVLEER